MGSLLEPRDRLWKGTRDVEWSHADVHIEHDASEGGANGAVEPLEGEKHLAETVLTILLRREKISIKPNPGSLGGSTPLDDKVEGRDDGLEIPLPLGQIGIAISVQDTFGVALK